MFKHGREAAASHEGVLPAPLCQSNARACGANLPVVGAEVGGCQEEDTAERQSG